MTYLCRIVGVIIWYRIMMFCVLPKNVNIQYRNVNLYIFIFISECHYMVQIIDTILYILVTLWYTSISVLWMSAFEHLWLVNEFITNYIFSELWLIIIDWQFIFYIYWCINLDLNFGAFFILHFNIHTMYIQCLLWYFPVYIYIYHFT